MNESEFVQLSVYEINLMKIYLSNLSIIMRKETKAVRVAMKMNVDRKRERRRPKERSFDTIDIYMKAVGVCVGDVVNQDEWRFRTLIKYSH